MVVETGFVGRRDQLRTLDAAWRSRPADGGAVIVSAEPGFGKTALIDEFLRRVGTAASVQRASPLQVETDTSWSTLRMLTSTAPTPELPPAVAVAVGRAPAGEAPPSLADVAFAWAESVRTTAASTPVLFVIDDLQWIDRSSAAAVATAMRSAPAFWLFGLRAGHDSHLEVERVVDAARVTRVTLPPMRRAEIGELVSRVHGGSWSIPAIASLAETSGGQPLHALELARELRSGDAAAVRADRRTLSDVYGDRLDALAPDRRDVVALAALAVHPTIAMLRALRPQVDIEEALAALEGDGVLRVGLDAVDFTHALARRAVTERLGAIERARLHRELADHVEDPERRAVHLGEGTTVPDASVAAELETAARAAIARGATFDGGRLAERAAELTPAQDRSIATARRVLAGIAYADAGDDERAVALLDHAAGLDDVPPALAFDATKSWISVISRRDGNAAAARIATARLPTVENATARGELHRMIVRLLQFDDVRAAERAAEAAVADARAQDDPALLLAADAALANARFLRGDHVDLDELIARLERHGDPLVRGQSAIWFVQEMAAWDDRFDDARHLCEAIAEAGRTSGRVTALLNAMSQQAAFEMHAGEIATCRKLVDELMDIVAPPPGARTYSVSEDVIMLAALAGEHEEAATLVREIEAELNLISPLMQLPFRALAGLSEITAGRFDAALVHLDAAAAIAERVGYEDVRSLGFQADHAEVLVHLGMLDRAAEVVAFLERAAERSRSSLVRTEALRCRGLLAGAQGLAHEAVTALTEAAATCATIGRPLVVGRTHLALGIALRRSGARAAAREQMLEARRVFEQLGSPPWIARADQELARLGTRTTTTSTLTPTERRIATLVTQGRSNREIATEMIVSLRTVESNLTRAYRKLGVRGRTELAARGSELLSEARGDG